LAGNPFDGVLKPIFDVARPYGIGMLKLLFGKDVVDFMILMENCGMCVQDRWGNRKYPRLISLEGGRNPGDSFVYYVQLPLGLGKSDFDKRQDKLAFGLRAVELDFDDTGDLLMIKGVRKS